MLPLIAAVAVATAQTAPPPPYFLVGNPQGYYQQASMVIAGPIATHETRMFQIVRA